MLNTKLGFFCAHKSAIVQVHIRNCRSIALFKANCLRLSFPNLITLRSNTILVSRHREFGSRSCIHTDARELAINSETSIVYEKFILSYNSCTCIWYPYHSLYKAHSSFKLHSSVRLPDQNLS